MLYRYNQSNLTEIQTEPVDPAIPLSLELPSYSLTLLVLQPGK
jgi:hypothetical protein